MDFLERAKLWMTFLKGARMEQMPGFLLNGINHVKIKKATNANIANSHLNNFFSLFKWCNTTWVVLPGSSVAFNVKRQTSCKATNKHFYHIFSHVITIFNAYSNRKCFVVACTEN